MLGEQVLFPARVAIQILNAVTEVVSCGVENEFVGLWTEPAP